MMGSVHFGNARKNTYKKPYGTRSYVVCQNRMLDIAGFHVIIKVLGSFLFPSFLGRFFY